MSNEVEITSWFARQSRLDPTGFPIGIGDDMAQVALAGGSSVLVTTDMLLEGAHFDLSKATLEEVGYKAMAVNISDCAAMATLPVAAVASVGLRKGWGQEQLKKLHSGIVECGGNFDCPLIGGDITKWRSEEGLSISITVLSRPAAGKPIRRSGARAGDCICVTGSLGGSLAGRHLRFAPRVREAIALTRLAKINAMIDISDGLSSDLGHICRLSGVGAVLESGRIPISEDAQSRPQPLAAALNDGEDFELLFTLTEDEYQRLQRHWKHQTVVTRIGTVTAKEGIWLVDADGAMTALTAAGFDHLASGGGDNV